MPELPEVETVANGLQQRVAGDVIESVWLNNKPQTFKSRPAEIAQALTGARIQRVRRVGKHIVADLTQDEKNGQWIIHLGMTGRMLVCQPDDELLKHTHLVARLKSGRELRFVDPRRFGRLAVSGQEFTGPGTEPTTISLEDFKKLFRKRKTPIKAAL